MTSRSKKRMVALIVLATLVVAVAGAYGARSILRQRSLARDLATGMAAYERADYPEGLARLSRYVGRIKTNSKAILALADCRRNIPEENGRHLITALAYSRAAAQAAPDDPKPLEMMLEICDKLGFSTEALEGATKLLAKDPGHLVALKARTRALASMGKIDGPNGALKSAQEMAAKHPEFVGAHDAVVQFMEALQRTPKEIRDYAEDVVAKHNERGASMEFALFECRVAITTADRTNKEDIEKISATVRRAASLPVRSREELADLIRYLDLMQLPVEEAKPLGLLSEEVLTRAAANPALARDVALLKVERAWKSGRGQSAQEGFAVPDRPFTEMSDRELGLREIMRDPTSSSSAAGSEAARAELNRRTTDEAKYWTKIFAGRDAQKTNDFRASVLALSEAAKLHPTYGFAQYFLGDALSRTGDWQAAAEQFAAAAGTDPVWRMARLASIKLLADNGRFEEARQQAADWFKVQRLQAYVVVYADVSVRMMEAHRTTEANAAAIIRELDEFHKLHSDIPAVGALRARGLLAAGRTDDARRAAAELLALPDPPPQESLVRLAIGLRPHDPALADRLDALAAKDPGAASNSVALRATMLATAGQLDQAKAMLQSAIAQSSGADKQRLTLLLGSVLDTARDPAAKELLIGLADANPRELAYQAGLLQASFAWADESIVKAPLARIGSILGQDSTQWRLLEARRLLTFSPSPENAAKVISSDREGLNLAKIVSNDAGNTEAAMILAQAYLLSVDKDGLGDTDAAIRTLARAVDADPSNPAAYPRLIDLLQKNGQPADATQRLTAFLRLKSLPVATQRQRARLLKNQGMLAQHSDELRDLASRGLAEDRLAYARDRAAAGDDARARPLFDALLAEERPSAEAVVAAAEFIVGRDGLEAGLRVLSKLPPETSVSDRKKLQAMLSKQGRRYDDAERLLKELTADNSAQAWADLAEFYVQQKRTDDAASTIQRGLAVAPEDTRLLWLSGAIRINSGKDNAAAFSELTKAAAAKDMGPDTREIVEVFRKYGPDSDDPRLVGALEAVTRRYPTSLQAWQLLVGIHRKARQWDQASKAALAAAQLLPADPRAARLATETLIEAQRFTEAEVMAGRWRELAPADATTVDIAQARLKCIRGQVPDALKLLDPHKAQIAAAADEKPEDLEVYAAALAAGGRVDEARQLLGDRVQTSPAWGVRYLRVAGVLMIRPEDARNWLAGLKIGDNAPAELLSAAAQAWLALGSTGGAKKEDLDESVRYALRLAAIQGQEGPGSSLLGTIYMSQDKADLAIGAYRVAAAKLPEDPGVLNNLAYLLALRSDGASEAVVLAKRAIDLATKQRLPDSFRRNVLETLGVAELRLGNFKEAEAAFRAGLAIDQNGIDLRIGLAEALVGLNQLPEAGQVVESIAGLTQRAPALSPALAARLKALHERVTAKR